MKKKVLVTGGCGFLGSHICELFVKENWEVISYDNLTKYELNRTKYSIESARNHNLDFLKQLKVENIQECVTNIQKLEESISQVDYVIHTAAQPAMTISLEDPKYDFNTNITGTFNILELAKKYKVPVAICSTVHVYGNEINGKIIEQEKSYTLKGKGIDESTPILMGNLTPLHASKGAADLYSKAYIDSYNLNAAVFRLTGIYGPRQFGGEDHGWVANFVIRNMLNKDINIFGNGKQTRDILYVADAAKAFLNYYNNQRPGIYNLSGGSSCEISLLETLDMIEKITTKKSKINFMQARIGDLSFFSCSCNKAKNQLHWSPTTLPLEGITKLKDWVQSNTPLFEY